MTLKDLKNNQKCIVTEITLEGAIRRRIMDMGITKGTEITIAKVAPLGDPIEIIVRGYRLSIRKSEAQNILVKEV